MNNQDFSKILCLAMKKTNTTQKKLSKHIGVTRQAIGQYMLGKTLPNIEIFKKIYIYFYNLGFQFPILQWLGIENNNINEIEKNIKELKEISMKILQITKGF